MANHHIRMFIVDGEIYYIHHNPADPTNDGPGKHLHVPHGDKVKWVSKEDGPFEIVFKKESPFTDLLGFPAGNPIQSSPSHNVDETTLDTLKPIPTITKSFPYSVTFDSGAHDDPEIIIDDSGGGPAGKGKKGKKKKKK